MIEQSPTFSECYQAVQEASDLGFNAGVVLGALCTFFLLEFFVPYLTAWLREYLHEARAKRGLQCHCDECEERPRKGIDD